MRCALISHCTYSVANSLAAKILLLFSISICYLPIAHSASAPILENPISCGELRCFRDLSVENAFLIEPNQLELVMRDEAPNPHLIRSTLNRERNGNEGLSDAAALLYVHLRRFVTEETRQKAEKALIEAIPEAKITGETALETGVLALLIEDGEGTIQWVARARTDPLSEEEMVALFELNSSQMEWLGEGDSSPSRLIFALEMGVSGWISPMPFLTIANGAESRENALNMGQCHESGTERLTHLTHLGREAIQQLDAISEEKSDEKAGSEQVDALFISHLEAHIAASWFRPASTLIPFEQFKSHLSAKEERSLLKWLRESVVQFDQREAEQAEKREALEELERENIKREEIEEETQKAPSKGAQELSIKKSELSERKGYFLDRFIRSVNAASSDRLLVSGDKIALWRFAQKANDDGAEAYERGEFGAAISAFQRAAEHYFRIYSTVSPAIEYNLAQSYRRRGDCEKAMLHYQSVIDEKHASDHDYLGFLGYSFLFLAQCMIEKGETEEAIAHLYRVLEVPATPEKTRVLMEAGELFTRLKRYCSALELFREAHRQLPFEESSHTGRAEERLEQVTEQALREIRARDKKLRPHASVESLQRVISEYQDFLLCAQPSEKERETIQNRIADLETELEKKKTQHPLRTEKGSVSAEKEASFSALRSLLRLESYCTQNLSAFSLQAAALTRWKKGEQAGELIVTTAKEWHDEKEEKAIWLSLSGESFQFFSEHIERVELFLRARKNAQTDPTLSRLVITPERFQNEANRFKISLPSMNRDDNETENESESEERRSIGSIERYELKAVWYYRYGGEIELPWRHIQQPWVLLHSPHRVQKITLSADPLLLSEKEIESVELVFQSELDSNPIHYSVTLSSEAPFMAREISFPVSVRQVPVYVDAVWSLKKKRTLRGRYGLQERHFDWSILPTENGTENSTTPFGMLRI